MMINDEERALAMHKWQLLKFIHSQWILAIIVRLGIIVSNVEVRVSIS